MMFHATPPPMEITSLLPSHGRFPILVELHSREYVGCLLIVVQSVFVLPLETLVNRVSQQSSQRNSHSAQDDDLVELFRTVCLRCPLSGMRIERPVRSVSCHHDQCFDLEVLNSLHLP